MLEKACERCADLYRAAAAVPGTLKVVPRVTDLPPSEKQRRELVFQYR